MLASLRPRLLRLTALALAGATLALLALARPAAAAPATLLDSTRCALPLQSRFGLGEGLGLGPQLSATGTIRAVMLFVDFTDAPAAGAPDPLFDNTAPGAMAWFRDQSRGRLTLNVTPIRRWYRMPQGATAYSPNPTADTGVKRLNTATVVRDAVRIADGDVDFSSYAIIYVALPPGIANVSAAFFPAIDVDGVRISRASMLASTASPGTMIHETGHLLGLPDLYETSAIGNADSTHFVGAWDLMSSTRILQLVSWHRWKLGWLDATQLRCLGSGVVEETITPLGALDAGLKMIVVPISPTQNYVAEVRDRVGADRDLCATGVLVYLVDSGVQSGTRPGPIQIRAAADTADPSRVAQCGLLYDAPHDAGRVARFRDAAAGVTIDVLGSSPAGFRVRVTAPELTAGSIPPAGGIGLAVYGGGSTTGLVNASGCDPATAVFWVTNEGGGFVTYVPGARVAIVNAPWNARFPRGIPANTAVLARCR